MDVIKTLTGLIKDVDNNDIDSLKDLYLELIYLRSELQAINYTHCCESGSEQLVCPNNEQHIVKKEGVGKYCMVCGVLK